MLTHMEKLKKELIDKGLDPRLKWCGFITTHQLEEKLKEFLPYCNVIIGEIKDDVLQIVIDFHDFQVNLNFKFKTSENNIKYIQKIY